MRVIKLMLISIVVLGILLYLMSLLFPSEIRVSRAINIGASKEDVTKKIRDLRQWEYWNDAVTGSDFTHSVFTDSSFSSDQIKVNLVYSSPDSIRTIWRNKKPTYAIFYLSQITPDTTVVQWYFDIPARVPWEKFSTLIMENQLGPYMEKALVNLKKIVENKQ
jgi:hypothetical protein